MYEIKKPCDIKYTIFHHIKMFILRATSRQKTDMENLMSKGVAQWVIGNSQTGRIEQGG